MESLLKIETLVHGALGLSHRADGKVIFIPYVLEEEEVIARIYEEKKDFGRALPLDILKASVKRVIPNCVYYGKCGGCHLQHALYSHQLLIKKNIFFETVKRAGLMDMVDKISHVEPSNKPFAYRHSMRFKVSENGELGLARLGTNEIISIKCCAISMDEINYFLSIIRDTPFWGENFYKIKEISVEISIYEGKTTLLFHIKEKLSDNFISFLMGLSFVKVLGLFYINDRDRKIELFSKENPYRIFPIYFGDGKKERLLMARPGSFVQNNWDINQKIINYLSEIFNIFIERDTILDLHTGIGNYLLPASLYFNNLIGCDVSKSSTEDLNYNAKNMGIKVNTIKNTAKNTLIDMIENKIHVDCVILDPPRGGCPDIINLFTKISPKLIVYVSCDPPALLRDLKNLIKHGYTVESIRLFDMFPQTYHMESVSLIRKRE